MTTQGLLGIYLNDHLAGAITGTGLARRMAAGRAGNRARGRLEPALNGHLVTRSPLLSRCG